MISEGHEEIEEQRNVIYFSDDPMATVIRTEGTFETIPDDLFGQEQLINEIEELLDPEGSIISMSDQNFNLHVSQSRRTITARYLGVLPIEDFRVLGSFECNSAREPIRCMSRGSDDEYIQSY